MVVEIFKENTFQTSSNKKLNQTKGFFGFMIYNLMMIYLAVQGSVDLLSLLVSKQMKLCFQNNITIVVEQSNF